MIDVIIKWFHIIAVIIWIGGMFFTLFVLKPNLEKIEDKKLEFMKSIMDKFFPFVWISIILLFITGDYYAKYFINNTFFDVKLFIYFIMVIIFSYIYFGLYKKIPYTKNKPPVFMKISKLITLNFVLGLTVIFLIETVRYFNF